MPKNKRSMTPNEKIIASALSSFQYTAHFWADDDMDAGRQNELLSPKKGESKKATHGELGYLKTRISEEFISEMNRLKKSNLEPLDLIDEIEKLVRRCEKLSENIRTYQEYYYVPSRNDYVHGYDVEEIPSSSGHRNAVSHDEGRLEKNFSAVRKKLDQVKVNYRQDLLVQDIHLQMEKIKKDGGFKNNKWNDATSRYPQNMRSCKMCFSIFQAVWISAS